MKTITATYARNNFSDIISRVEYRGEEFVIERNGKQVAIIKTPKKKVKSKQRLLSDRLGDHSLDLGMGWEGMKKIIKESKDPRTEK